MSISKEQCTPVLLYSLEQHQNHELKPGVSQQDNGVYIMNQHALGLNVQNEPTSEMRNLGKQNTQLCIPDQVNEDDESRNLNKVDQASKGSVYSGNPTSVKDTGTNIDRPDSDSRCGTMHMGYHRLKPDLVVCQASDANCNLVGTAEVIRTTGYSYKRKTLAFNGNISNVGDNWLNNTTSKIHDKNQNEFAEFWNEERDENSSVGNTNYGGLTGAETLSENGTASTDRLSEACSSCDEDSLEETASDSAWWNIGPGDVSPSSHIDTLRWDTGPGDMSPICHCDVQTRPGDVSPVTCHGDLSVYTEPCDASLTGLGDTTVNTRAIDFLPFCHSNTAVHPRLADMSLSCDNDATVNTSGPTNMASAYHCDTVVTTGPVAMSTMCTRQNSSHTHVADGTIRSSRSLSLNDIGEFDGLDVEDITWRHSYSRWTIPDPGSQKLNWNKPPLTVLVVKKMFDEGALTAFKQLVMWLVQTKHMVVFVEKTVLEDNILKTDQQFQELIPKLKIFVEQKDDLTNKVDFIICLGGDGTLLYASSLFQASVPPVMAFNLGSLGFLTPFNFENFKENVSHVLEGHASLLLRYRLKCCVHNIESSIKQKPLVNKTESSNSCRTSILVFNEVVVDRGQSSYLTNLDLYVEGRLVTSAQGDGIIISTPTGSTAYAVAAGASMVHPNVPAIVITPICPHSLSFRPVVVPAGVEIKIVVSPESRNPAWASFDGRDRQRLQPGEHVCITTAQYPVPSVCAKDQIDDWFDSLAECLHWNVRRTQKPLSSVSSVASLDSLTDQNDLSN